MNRPIHRIARLFVAANFVAVCFVASVAAAPVPSQTSTLKLGSVTASPGSTVKVPIYWTGHEDGIPVQALAVKIRWASEASVTEAGIERAGSTAALQPIFETTPSTANSIAWVAAFQEDLGQSRYDGATLIAVARITIATTAGPGSTISLSLDPQTSVLSNREGTHGASVANGTLKLIDGRIRVVDGRDKPRGAQR